MADGNPPCLPPPVFTKNWRQLLKIGEVIGDAAAPVKVVEFGDFECPYCRRADSVYHRIAAKYGSGVALVFIHDPLSIHRFAMPAARAAECAASQGRFGPFHDDVYAKQDSLGLKSWTSFAQDAGVGDLMAFDRCNSITQTPRLVELGVAAAAQFNVHSTPTILVNGWRFSAPPTESALDSAITAERHAPLGSPHGSQ